MDPIAVLAYSAHASRGGAMQNSIFMITLWLACGAATMIAAVLAGSRSARYLGRAAVGVLFIVGGALLHIINLVSGGDMLPAMVVLLVAERRANAAPAPATRVGESQRAGVGP
jgi:hypothetical protein